ncbi:MAG: hypothetical protein Q8J64_03020 [Thermodesulfovibrionales bacterium]|nr:hypothetical protein [Thermodesulfovibrionales bacterium]
MALTGGDSFDTKGNAIISWNGGDVMKTKGATAEVFYTAFKTMPKKEQNVFLVKVLKDERLREDLMDIAIAEGRVKSKSRRFRDFLKEHEN